MAGIRVRSGADVNRVLMRSMHHRALRLHSTMAKRCLLPRVECKKKLFVHTLLGKLHTRHSRPGRRGRSHFDAACDLVTASEQRIWCDWSPAAQRHTHSVWAAERASERERDV
jgi:hypothetical protein